METAKNGSYSGLCAAIIVEFTLGLLNVHLIIGYLQIQFLSSAIRKKETSTLHIMWMQFNEESSSMNHVCPLILHETISESCKTN